MSPESLFVGHEKNLIFSPVFIMFILLFYVWFSKFLTRSLRIFDTIKTFTTFKNPLKNLLKQSLSMLSHLAVVKVLLGKYLPLICGLTLSIGE